MSTTLMCDVCGLHHNFIDGYIPVDIRCSRCLSYLVQEVDISTEHMEEFDMNDYYVYDMTESIIDTEELKLPTLPDDSSGHNTHCEYCSSKDDNELLIGDETDSYTLKLKINHDKDLSLVYISNDNVVSLTNDIFFCPICGKELTDKEE